MYTLLFSATTAYGLNVLLCFEARFNVLNNKSKVIHVL